MSRINICKNNQQTKYEKTQHERTTDTMKTRQQNIPNEDITKDIQTTPVASPVGTISFVQDFARQTK